MRDFQAARDHMVQSQLEARGIRDARILAAFRDVPRHAFVPEGYQHEAYDDTPLPIGEGQTISQPYMVAIMLEAAAIEPGDRILEIGAGCGYASALISRIADRVFAIERIGSLADAAAERLARLGYANVELKAGDGSDGWPEEGPYDAIIVSAAAPTVPPALKEQLTIGGRLVIPTGRASGLYQTLLRIVRTGEDRWREEDLGGVRFVPLISDKDSG